MLRVEEEGEGRKVGREGRMEKRYVNLSHRGSDVTLNICPPGSTSLLYNLKRSTRYNVSDMCLGIQ